MELKEQRKRVREFAKELSAATGRKITVKTANQRWWKLPGDVQMNVEWEWREAYKEGERMTLAAYYPFIADKVRNELKDAIAAEGNSATKHGLRFYLNERHVTTRNVQVFVELPHEHG